MNKPKKTSRSRKGGRRAPGKRNKKLQAEGLKMPPTFSLLLVMLFSVGLFFLWFCSRTEAMARQIKIEEQHLEDISRQVGAEESRWSNLIGPKNLQAALTAHDLKMDWPRQEQVVHIRDMDLWEANAGELNVIGRLDRDPGGYDIQ